MAYEITHDDGIRISDDAQRFDIGRAHGWIGGRSYWGQGIPEATFRAAIANSLAVGAYGADGAMVGSRAVVRALRAMGGKPRYTEYPGEKHVIWPRAYGEAALLPWILDQRLPGPPCDFASPAR